MKLTSQEEYGLRCLLQIAREPGGYLTIPEIATRESLTPAYVAKLMRVLRKGQLVESIRGKKGGYRLARPPEQIDVGTALNALGGRLFPKRFCGRFSGNINVCTHDIDCSIRSFWSAVDVMLQRALSKTTLRHLLSTERDMVAWTRTNVLEAENGAAPLRVAQ